MDTTAISKGIAAYAHEQEVFMRLLRKRGGFTEEEFDTWFIGREWKRQKRALCVPIVGDSFILGGISGSQWAKMLELLQFMILLGKVEADNHDGVIVYRKAKAH